MNNYNVDHIVLGAGIVGVWLTKALLQKGKKVALVDIGKRTYSSVSAKPEIIYLEKVNQGSVAARNHVVTGNSAFWGGGMIRNNEKSLNKMFGYEPGGDESLFFERMYKRVENKLNEKMPNRELDRKTGIGSGDVSEVCILPGKKRGIWLEFINEWMDSPNLFLFDDTRIKKAKSDGAGRIQSIVIENRYGEAEVTCQRVVISMGVVDSIRFVSNKLKHIVGDNPYLGSHLHDHWSIPVMAFHWKKSMFLSTYFPPKFLRGNIVGRRMEIEASSKYEAQGFIHFQSDFDQIEPYKSLKELLSYRQKGKSIFSSKRVLSNLFRNIPALIRILAEKLFRSELYVPEGTRVRAVLDFESYPVKENNFKNSDDEIKMKWNVRGEDVLSFVAFDALSKLEGNLKECNYDVKRLINYKSVTEAKKQLEEAAVDAFHLGGGLQIGCNSGDGLVDKNLRLFGSDNIWVIGTSVFRRPGIANPVFTLLALSELYLESLES